MLSMFSVVWRAIYKLGYMDVGTDRDVHFAPYFDHLMGGYWALQI